MNILKSIEVENAGIVLILRVFSTKNHEEKRLEVSNNYK